MKNTKLKITLALASALLMSMATLASASSALPSFEQLDLDKDGYISMQEAQSNEEVTEKFAAADANKDEMLDQAEYSSLGHE